ncbi:hypothetical protein BC826DRAFT_996719 [Russula brevipes]|nr:hypothetical protein BC826DRAFT_1025584 [Russula brevipes]KAI0298811.1 hypothetical protein BC826DRAFT_996719 [Russula brevipes]
MKLPESHGDITATCDLRRVRRPCCATKRCSRTASTTRAQGSPCYLVLLATCVLYWHVSLCTMLRYLVVMKNNGF